MTGRQKLLSLWVCLLLMATVCPGAQYAHSKRGFFKSGKKDEGKKDEGKKGDDGKAPPSKGRGISKQGLKWAGAAAAGMLGGTGTGYGLGGLLRPKHGSKSHHGHKGASHQEDQRQYYYQEGQRNQDQSRWRLVKAAAAPARTSSVLLTYAAPLLVAAWVRAI